LAEHPDSPPLKLAKTDAISSQGNTASDWLCAENSEGMIPVTALSFDVDSETFICLDRSSPDFGFQGMGSFQETSSTPFVSDKVMFGDDLIL
jgi:hypothetical protein